MPLKVWKAGKGAGHNERQHVEDCRANTPRILVNLNHVSKLEHAKPQTAATSSNSLLRKRSGKPRKHTRACGKLPDRMPSFPHLRHDGPCFSPFCRRTPKLGAPSVEEPSVSALTVMTHHDSYMQRFVSMRSQVLRGTSWKEGIWQHRTQHALSEIITG